MQIVRDCETLNIGGKAANLCRLREFCSVPPFFIVCFDSPEEIDNPTKQREIVNECERRGFDVMAVRSSASCEDSEEASFAGMFETILGASKDNLMEAMSSVILSVRNKRVAAYCATTGIQSERIRMFIIVQRLVSSRVSGVCLTRGRSQNELVIEACYGLGAGLVDGRITPDRYILSRDSLVVLNKSISYQANKLIADRQKFQVGEGTIPFHRRASAKLTRKEVLDIGDLCLSIERKLGLDGADVEWAYEDEQLFILQTRPLINESGLGGRC